MTGTTILAIDLGKYKCVSCAYDRATAAAEFRTVATSRAEVERLIRDSRPVVVVIEACTLAGWVSDLCAEIGVACKVANTAAEAWRYKHAKRKTDRDDALRLAQLEALGQLPTVVVPAKAVREWRALIAHRQALVTQRVAAQNRIRAILVGQGLPAPRTVRTVWTMDSPNPCAARAARNRLQPVSHAAAHFGRGTGRGRRTSRCRCRVGLRGAPGSGGSPTAAGATACGHGSLVQPPGNRGKAALIAGMDELPAGCRTGAGKVPLPGEVYFSDRRAIRPGVCSAAWRTSRKS